MQSIFEPVINVLYDFVLKRNPAFLVLPPILHPVTNCVNGNDLGFRIHGTDEKATRYEAASSANELSGGATPEPCKTCSSGRSVSIGGERSITFKIAPLKRSTFVQIHYINRSASPLSTQLSVDGQMPTNILFPPTGGGDEVGSVTVEVESKQTGSESTLRFCAPGAKGPAFESISLLAAAN